MPELSRRCAAEFLGTFFLVFAGTGAVVFDVPHVGVALTFGLVVMVLIYAIGNVSGAHMNPAVTLALAAAGLAKWRDVVPYALCQLAGACLASGLLSVVSTGGLGATQAKIGEPQSAVLEAILTFMLVYTIRSVVAGSAAVQSLGGVIIGGMIGLEAMFAGPACGASMNPARSIAPAVVSGQLAGLWVYVVGPIVGGLLAVPVWGAINAVGREKPNGPTR